MEADNYERGVPVARSSHQKLKPLYIMDYLLRHSDEEHPVTVNQIISYLAAQDIQYSQGFAVVYPMNMHFYASIYPLCSPKGVPKISYDTFLYRFVSLFREIGKLTNYPALLCPLCPITPWVKCGSKILRIY